MKNLYAVICPACIPNTDGITPAMTTEARLDANAATLLLDSLAAHMRDDHKNANPALAAAMPLYRLGACPLTDDADSAGAIPKGVAPLGVQRILSAGSGRPHG